MPRVHSFPPIVAADAQILILGTMPGVASLEAGQYYGHPRNHFWPIMEALFEMPGGLAYEQRCDALRQARVAVWDVLQSCQREGSLDSAIAPESVVANDYTSLLFRCPDLKTIAFNGQKASALFRRHVFRFNHSGGQDATPVKGTYADLRYLQLPSTSPAYASMTLMQKTHRWRAVLDI